MRDAPYIEEAEREGMPHPETMECPVCGKETSEIFHNAFLEIVGCPRCVRKTTVDKWRRVDEDE